jgi:phosphoenolpyruvate carboxylase
LNDLDLRLRQAWVEAGYHADTLIYPASLPRIRFGTWVGGDRDGHPLVTAEVTRETFRELRQATLQVLYDAVGALSRQLTMTRHEQKASEELVENINRLAAELSADSVLQLRPEEPWRQFSLLIQKKVSHMIENKGYTAPFELRSDLLLLARSVEEIGAGRITRSEILPVIRLVDVFGFHGAVLDIRQNSQFHDRALVQILERASMAESNRFAEWDQEERLPFLQAELLSRRPFLAPGTPIGPEADAVLSCFRVIKEYRDQYGIRGIGSLIISYDAWRCGPARNVLVRSRGGLMGRNRRRSGMSTACRTSV